MNDWTYRRGRWTNHRPYSLSSREHESLEKLELWNRIRRWKKFPQLGPVPEQWMKYGGVPPFHVMVGEALKAFYIGPIRQMLNEPTPLLKYLEKR